MAFHFGNSSSGGTSGAITVPSDYVFSTTTERDSYFTTNSSELVDNIYCTVDGVLEQYDADSATWVDMSAVISGDDAPDVEIQYSSDISSWHTTFVADSDIYIRFSTDAGTSWSDGYKFIGDDAPNMVIQYSTTGTSSWHTTRTESDTYWRWSTDGGTTFSDAALFATSSTGIPSPYSATVDESGALAILDGDGDTVMTVDDEGLWATSLSTTTGSVHLGQSYSLGGGVETLILVTEYDDTAHFNSKGKVTTDGLTYTPIEDRILGDRQSYEVNGSVDTNTAVDYNFSFTVSANICFFSLDVLPAEDYEGELTWYCYLGTDTTYELAYFTHSIDITSGTQTAIQFEYPMFVESGTTLLVQLKKEDGTYLSTYVGEDGVTPWRLAILRTFSDELSYNAGNLTDLVTNLNATYVSNDGIEWSTLANIPTAGVDTLGISSPDGTTITVDSGVYSVEPANIDITEFKNASSFLSGALQGSFDETVTEDFFTYSDDANTVYTIDGMWWIYGATDGSTTITLNGYTLSSGDIILCITDVDTTITSSNFSDYFTYIPDSTAVATTTTKGGIILTNDLGGTYDAPVVEHVDGANVEYSDTSTSTKYYFEITDGIAYMVEV